MHIKVIYVANARNVLYNFVITLTIEKGKNYG